MIKKLQAGDSTIPASGWNEMRAFIQNYSAPQDTFKNAPRNPFLISVKNTTGAALDPLSIVAITTPTHTRTGSTFANKGVEYGVEMDGTTPTGAADNIAVLQGGIQNNCIGKAIADGCTPCFVNKTANTAYKYARPVASHSDYLEGTDEVTNIRVLWIASGTGKKEAVICLDASGEPTPEYFVINPGNDGTQTAVNDYSLYTKGSLHYIGYDSQSQIWVPITGNETAPTSAPYTRPSARLAICQVDAPNSAKEFKMPYYTPESNLGVPPDVDSNNPYLNDYNFSTAEHRCGVVLGEHKFSGKNYDYFTDSSGKYGYQPNFLAVVVVQGNTGGWNNPYIVLNGEQIDIHFNTTYLYGPSCPDIYPYDSITIEFCVNAPYQWAIDYPRDYPSGTYMAFYNSPGRGWVADTTPQGMQDAGLTLYRKDKTGAIT